MSGYIPILVALGILVCLVPSAGAITIDINATPAEPHIGDTVIISGNVTGLKTIAVYLYVKGQDLDPHGVILDNLNIPAGRGMFTTTPVNMGDGSWEYAWDTSVILGTLKPGRYTVYVMVSPMDRFRFVPEEQATVDLTFLPSNKPENEVPLSPAIPVMAVFFSGLIVWCMAHRSGR
ncbi:MAG: hypothetical protein WC015_05320 [Methanoregula sp.]|jgi:hypothetical protein